MTLPLRCLVVDDEALARQRMARMLAEVPSPVCMVIAQAADAVAAMTAIQSHAIDAAFLDINMPGLNGLEFARKLQSLAPRVQIVFVTAHAEHAVEAFSLHAADYLTKPVKAQRLQECVQRIAASPLRGVTPPADAPTLLINDAHRSYRIAVDDVLLLRAELKYVSAITLGASGEPAVHILSESLAELEAAWPTHFVRTHRNSLVRRRALVGLVRGSIAAADDDDPSTESWIAQVQGITEGVSVSRRQLPAVRQALKDLGRH